MSDRSYGRLVVGALLVVVGLVWFVHALGIFEFPLRVLTPVALSGIGIALVAGSGRGTFPLLIALGGALVVALTGGSVADRDRGGLGERVERPSFAGRTYGRDYSLGAGRLVLDLTGVRADHAEVTAEVGTGRLEVTVPDGVAVHIESSSGVGSIRVFGEQRGSGFGVDDTFESPDLATASSRIELDLSVGIGSIDVRRGTPGLGRPDDADRIRREVQERIRRQREEIERRRDEFRRRQDELQRRFREPEVTGAPA